VLRLAQGQAARALERTEHWRVLSWAAGPGCFIGTASRAGEYDDTNYPKPLRTRLHWQARNGPPVVLFSRKGACSHSPISAQLPLCKLEILPEPPIPLGNGE